ncbi:MAG TPA: SidA/IucD/PvdA family monooxygenase, partial [Actinomycetota bacterium]|nr:SidA/IucD/PvdA family monooxygenase [Actinomycetota bacterium]
TPDVPRFHTVGIGAGPANLSLAALYQSSTSEAMALFDRQVGPTWHASLLHTGARMQTSWLKDLVSLVDPTHQLTFVNYLVSTGRLFALLNAQFDFIPRREYMQYLAWASRQIHNIHYGVTIDEISFTGDGFVVAAAGRPVARSQHLVVGVGTRPVMPPGLSWLPDHRVFVADDLGWRIDGMSADRHAPVAVVGGGQTGLEAVLRLLGSGFSDIRWLGRRQWFQTIDDSPVANEFYRPAHQEFLQTLSRRTRRALVEEQNPTGDALTPGALRGLYQANYDRMLELGRFPVTLLPGRDVSTAVMDGDDLVLSCTTTEGKQQQRVRYAVVAVGRELVPVPFDDDLRARVETDQDGELVLEADYSVRWDGPRGPTGHSIYALNRGRLSHGIPDANLTLLPVRSAIVLNSMFGRQMFQVPDELCPISWN